MNVVRVEHVVGDRFEVRVRGHTFVTDQPVDAGGTDAGPTPMELFVSGLVACVGYYAVRFLRRHGVPERGLAVEGFFDMSTEPPARVAAVRLRVRVPPGLAASRRTALERVVKHCTVHNSMMTAPDVTFELSYREDAA